MEAVIKTLCSIYGIKLVPVHCSWVRSWKKVLYKIKQNWFDETLSKDKIFSQYKDTEKFEDYDF